MKTWDFQVIWKIKSNKPYTPFALPGNVCYTASLQRWKALS